MKALASLLVAVAIALAVASEASAKGCVRIRAASIAKKGESVRVTVRTYESRLDNGKVVPGAPAFIAIPRFKVVAEGPNGRVFRFVAKRVGTSTVRIARIAFPARGLWRLTAASWKYAPRSCAAPAFVRVR